MVKDAAVGKLLAELREGRSTFDEFARRTAPTWTRLAAWFLRRWPGQAAVDEEDLRQELLLAAWRAVSEWDPTRGVAIDRFVFYQTGLAATRTLKRALSYRKGRGSVWTLPLPREAAVEPGQHRVAVVRERLERARAGEGLEGEVAGALLEHRPLAAVAEGIYRDPARRFRYRLGSESDAAARVRQAAAKLASTGG